MEKEYIIRGVAGIMIIVGVVLAYLVSILWLLLPLFVGINLLQSSFTKFCPLDLILKKKK
ncbi:YgaP family membrane protein [Prevotella sp.]|uniref:YgaP family membrane protein n=1 Tax=Prevotella sp. TaxID=59823 RepID=UPI003DA4F135